MTRHTEAEMREALAAMLSLANDRMKMHGILADAIAELVQHRSELEKTAQRIADERIGAPGPRAGRFPEPRKPVCAVCGDTHLLPGKTVDCVSCPKPCKECRGVGKDGYWYLLHYCAATPCDCACHR